MNNWNNTSLEQVRGHAIASYRKARGSRPDVLLIEIDGERAVLKDFSNSDTWFRRLLAPMLVRREVRSLQRLDAIAGIPRLLQVYPPNAFLIEAVAGKPASAVESDVLDARFFERMQTLVNKMHDKGVAHCDLRSTGNTLITVDQQPWLVDFVASIKQGSRWNLPSRWLFGKFVTADNGAVLKLKQRLAPSLVSEQERARLDEPRGVLENIARFIGKTVRNLTRRLLARGSKENRREDA
jgi:predicted Ser/Thr protein kinase